MEDVKIVDPTPAVEPVVEPVVETPAVEEATEEPRIDSEAQS